MNIAKKLNKYINIINIQESEEQLTISGVINFSKVPYILGMLRSTIQPFYACKIRIYSPISPDKRNIKIIIKKVNYGKGLPQIANIMVLMIRYIRTNAHIIDEHFYESDNYKYYKGTIMNDHKVAATYEIRIVFEGKLSEANIDIIDYSYIADLVTKTLL